MLQTCAKPKVLLLAVAELVHQPRLLKAGRYWQEKGCEVVGFSPLVGLADVTVYQRFRTECRWQLIERDLSKQSLSSRLRWLLVSARWRLRRLLVRRKWLKPGDDHLCKVFTGLSANALPRCDLIVVNLPETLPFARRLARRWGADIVFDSQEDFAGQYQHAEALTRKVIEDGVQWAMASALVVCATTRAMATQLSGDAAAVPRHKIQVVRNLPYDTGPEVEIQEHDGPLRLVWHGMVVAPKGRGVDVMIRGVARSKVPCVLTLQGRLSAEHQQAIRELAASEGFDGLEFAGAAAPDQIIQSLIGADIGLLGEQGLDRNNRLSSSNKLFDYIHAGLAVLASDTPGIMETLETYPIGLSYAMNEPDDLAQVLRRLDDDRKALWAMRRESLQVRHSLVWPEDYDSVGQLVFASKRHEDRES
ncbi:MAG: glycosyltransferase [Lysobacterales bacterium]